MANGDLVKLGTFYLNGTKQKRPTFPWRNDTTPTGAPGAGNIPNYSSGNIEIKDTDADDTYKIQWREVNDTANNKKLLIADRNLLAYVPWDTLNSQGLITGKTITIDGQQYKLRVLTGGTDRRNSSDSYSGGTPTNNEWDRIVVNEAGFSGLPTPNSTDLDTSQNETDRTGTHNQFWNWYCCYSWCQETYQENSSTRVVRGLSSARFFNYCSSYGSNYNVGWRPALEILNTAPLISDEDRNLGNYAAAFVKNYTVNDADGDTITVTEKLDGSVIRTLNNQASGTSLIVDLTTQWSSLSLAGHTITIEVTDSKGLAGATRTWTFTKTNSSPGNPIINKPLNLMRVPQNFDVIFITALDAEGDTQDLQVQIADDADFNQNAEIITSGLQRYNDDIQQWEDVANVSNDDNGKTFRIPVNVTSLNVDKYIRVGSIDVNGSNTASWSEPVKIHVGNILDFQTLPSEVDFMPISINVVDKKNVDADATIKVFACNNALDTEPTWEEITTKYTNKQPYDFTNKTKTADKWAISIRYHVEANDAVGEIKIEAAAVGVS